MGKLLKGMRNDESSTPNENEKLVAVL